MAWIAEHEFINYDVYREEPRDNNQTCFIPQYHPFHSSILKYVKTAHPIKCRDFQPPLTWIDDHGFLRFNKTALQNTLWSRSTLKCEYSEVLRDNSNHDDVFKFNTSKPFVDAIDVSHSDFIQVQCKQFFGIVIYYNIHAHIRDKLFAHHRLSSQKAKNGGQKYNVLMFGIDSLSRLNAMRQLPKTFKFFKNTLKSYILRGYFKVGGNTFPNLATMLTGYHPYQKPPVYFPLDEEHKPHDPWPFIWKNYSAEGFRTLFAEDFPEFNAFHYMSGGFDAQPTDHYARTLWTAVESTLLYKSSSYMCFGSQPKYKYHIDYIKRFVSHLYNNTPFWGLSFLSEICHDYLNTVGAADNDLYSFVKHLHDKHFLNNTVFIFFSDHGNRYSEIRETYLGGIEDKMPLFTVFFPERFSKSQPDAVANLKRNEMRLTSAFDVYCMLIDILRLSSNPSHQVGKFKTLHGLSLFGNIPANRSCLEAGIDGEYCSCTQETGVPITASFIKGAANYLVKKINSILLAKYKNFNLCAELVLSKVKNARFVGSIEEMWKATKKTFKVVFETSPSGGVFEGTIYIAGPKNDVFVGAGDIERINRYGDQSKCIDDHLLRIYCFCG